MRRRLFWIAEVFIWALILFAVAGLIIVVKGNYKKNFNNYQIFLPDVDGLIKGSPVRLMGINIGYVNQINIVGEDVYVKFIITQPHVKIPAGSTATVEFSGLGGSKSLELYPPTKESDALSEKFITPQSPKRIHDSLGLLMDMYDQFMDIAYTVSHFMGQVGIIREKNNLEGPSDKYVNSFLDSVNQWLDNVQEKSNKIKEKLKLKKDGKNERRQDKFN